MIKYDINDTIAAISTPVGESGIGIVRISGKDALKVADKIFLSTDGKKSSTFKTYTTHYGWVVNSHRSHLDFTHGRQVVGQRPNSKAMRHATCDMREDIVDEVILTVMRAPKSYTKEDIVEINCHGGIVALRSVLDLVLEKGCRLAEPGEFTKRAFLNGRIDLAQAEAVLDIIRAKTDSSLKIGVEQLKGDLSNSINKIRKTLLEALSIIEASIDFPEEEISSGMNFKQKDNDLGISCKESTLDLENLTKKLKRIDNELRDILDSSKHGQVLREGLHVVICGKPNVGKSSLLNAILRQERSIVTPVAGTTRDTIEEIIDIGGIPIRIVDTAGIIEPHDLVERKAIRRSKKYVDLADLIILMFDGSRKLTKEDRILIKKLKKKQIIAVINKIDLKQNIEREKIAKQFVRMIDISAKRCQNINLLEEGIANLVFNSKMPGPESVIVSNLRHILALREVKKLVAEARKSLDNKLSLEFVSQDIKEALVYLDDILGKSFSEDLLDKIFRDFCIGK